MKIFILVTFLLATIRTITPLIDRKNFTISRILISVLTTVAYAYLLGYFIEIK